MLTKTFKKIAQTNRATITALLLVIAVSTLAGGVVLASTPNDVNQPKTESYVGEAAISDEGYIVVRHVEGEVVDLSDLRIKVTVHKDNGEKVRGTIETLPLKDQRVPTAKTAGELKLDERWGAVNEQVTEGTFSSSTSLIFISKADLSVNDDATITVINTETGRVLNTHEVDVRDNIPMDLPKPSEFFKVYSYEPSKTWEKVGTKTKISQTSPGEDWEKQGLHHYEQVQTGTYEMIASSQPGSEWIRAGIHHYEQVVDYYETTTSTTSPGDEWTRTGVDHYTTVFDGYQTTTSLVDPGVGWNRDGIAYYDTVIVGSETKTSTTDPGSEWVQGDQVGTERTFSGYDHKYIWSSNPEPVSWMNSAWTFYEVDDTRTTTKHSTEWCTDYNACMSRDGYTFTGRTKSVVDYYKTTHSSTDPGYGWTKDSYYGTSYEVTGYTYETKIGYHEVEEQRKVVTKDTEPVWVDGHWEGHDHDKSYECSTERYWSWDTWSYETDYTCSWTGHDHDRTWVDGHYEERTTKTVTTKTVTATVWGPYQERVPQYGMVDVYTWKKPVYETAYLFSYTMTDKEYKLDYVKSTYDTEPVYEWHNYETEKQPVYSWSKATYSQEPVYSWEKPVYKDAPVYNWEKPVYSEEAFYEWTTEKFKSIFGSLVNDGETSWTLVNGATIAKDSTITVHRTDLTTDPSNAFTLTADGERGDWTMKVYRSGDSIVVVEDGKQVWSGKTDTVKIDAADNTITTSDGTTHAVQFRLGSDIEDSIGEWSLKISNADSARGAIEIVSSGD